MDDLEEDWFETFGGLKDDWQIIERVLPNGWEAAAKDTGAMTRNRGFDGPSTLLRILLIHLADGCSLRETAARARAGGLANISDVALLNRLRGCGEWFRWMSDQMVKVLSDTTQEMLPGKRIRLVDASITREPGVTGSMWRLHYMIDLSTLRCEQTLITSPDDGESLTRFDVSTGDVIMADRGLAHRRGIRHVVDQGGDVVIRMNLIAIPLEPIHPETAAFELLPRLRELDIGGACDWHVQIRDEKGVIPVRVCALKKSKEATETAQKKLRRRASKRGHALQPETLEVAGYVIVLTTLNKLSAAAILELYRHRWQIELAFKRLKSILHLGHLKKTDPESAKAWLQGKLLVATIIEMLIAIGERFSPWGYFLRPTQRAPLPLA